MANLFRKKQNKAAGNSKKTYLGLIVALSFILLAVALTYTTYAALTVSRGVAVKGGVTATANLGIYTDSTCQTTLTSLDWGTPTPGTSVTRVIYIKNTGSGVSLLLSLDTSDWNPAMANGPIKLSLDKAGTRLNPGESTAASVTLTVSPTIVDILNYTFTLTITGSQ